MMGYALASFFVMIIDRLASTLLFILTFLSPLAGLLVFLGCRLST